jgi:hypothetical protein
MRQQLLLLTQPRPRPDPPIGISDYGAKGCWNKLSAIIHFTVVDDIIAHNLDWKPEDVDLTTKIEHETNPLEVVAPFRVNVGTDVMKFAILSKPGMFNSRLELLYRGHLLAPPHRMHRLDLAIFVSGSVDCVAIDIVNFDDLVRFMTRLLQQGLCVQMIVSGSNAVNDDSASQ